MGARQKDILDLTKDIQKSSLISYLEQSPIKSQTYSGSPGGWIKQTHVRRKDYEHSYLGMSSASTLRGNSQSSLTWGCFEQHAVQPCLELCDRELQNACQNPWQVKDRQTREEALSPSSPACEHLLLTEEAETHIWHMLAAPSESAPPHNWVKTWSFFCGFCCTKPKFLLLYSYQKWEQEMIKLKLVLPWLNMGWPKILAAFFLRKITLTPFAGSFSIDKHLNEFIQLAL